MLTPLSVSSAPCLRLKPHIPGLGAVILVHTGNGDSVAQCCPPGVHGGQNGASGAPEEGTCGFSPHQVQMANCRSFAGENRALATGQALYWLNKVMVGRVDVI